MTDEKIAKGMSKLLSLVLRHAPETIELPLDENGWADVSALIIQCNKHGKKLDRELLDYIVENNDKKRFAYNESQTKIRANQGHSIAVDLKLEETEPLPYLYHGTVAKSLESIMADGLKKMSRQHVHLSGDRETAVKVGARRGTPHILIVKSGKMFKDGFKFYLSENRVWLTDEVPVKYIAFSDEENFGNR